MAVVRVPVRAMDVNKEWDRVMVAARAWVRAKAKAKDKVKARDLVRA
jgi:hypothetical protein